MSEVGAADRSSRLRSKRAQTSGIVISHKRKLREFFAVCDNDEPTPITYYKVDAPPSPPPAESRFLDACNILQDRFFELSNLLPRRKLRSNTSKRSSNGVVSPRLLPVDVSRNPAKSQRDAGSQKSRGISPRGESAGEPRQKEQSGPLGPERTETDLADGLSTAMQRSTSKGSQTDLPADSAAVLDEVVDETFENATHQQPSPLNAAVPVNELESDRIRTGLGTSHCSPGVYHRKVLPISTEDAVQVPEPLVDGLGLHDQQHKATTVDLPPREAQERHLRQIDSRLADKVSREQKEEQVGRLSIHLPPREGGRAADPLSSPGSTVGAHSATTPALHEASTDTSPDNEGSRYGADRLENKDDDPQTPPELARTVEEAAEQAEHDRIPKAQIEISRAEILGSCPSAADTQLRMEEQAAAAFTEPTSRDSQNDSPRTGDRTMKISTGIAQDDESDCLTQEADEVVQDVMEDEDDEVVGVPTPEDETTSVSALPAPRADSNKPEIADSQSSEDQTPVNAKDVSTTTEQDSFESNAALESVAETSPIVPRAADSSTRPPRDSEDTSSATPPVSTPRWTPSTSAATAPALERMTTRVSSGAMRHKSISEILGEIPRPNTTSSSERSAVGKGTTDSDSPGGSNSPSRSTTPQSPGTRMRSLVERAKEKERSKLSTVVFAKQPPKRDDVTLMPSGARHPQPESEDYLTPLFLATATQNARGGQALDALLQSAHKTISTSNAYVPINENQTTKVLKRIYNLQTSNKWSLRQPKRSQEPNRPTTHWDVLLQEVKWMRTDFREERKWKITTARNMAFACAEWVAASAEDRKLLQVTATPPARPTIPATGSSEDMDMGDTPQSQDLGHLTPELVSSGEFNSPMDEFDDEPRINLLDSIAPTVIFALQDDDVVFGLRRSPTTDKLLQELPMYGAPLSIPQYDLPTSEIDPDAAWRRPALPLSKYVEGQMELKIEGPPRNRSRYQYEDEDEDEDQVVFGEQRPKQAHLKPEQTDVALFNPQNKHIRDRIHAGHQFRPPSEYPMPLQSFFECRTASQWTLPEDDELRGLVREYSYNWSLISSMLTSRSLFSSGAERRTPWECFERWIHLEGLPADMHKTHYFRAYNNRLEAAQRNLMAQAAQAPPQPNATGQAVTPVRRRTTTSIRVERRRNQKHLTLVDAMRKLAKKRETSLQKQQHAAGLAAMRKANEVPQPRAPVHTPQDFSRLKHDREIQLAERMAQLQQRQEANRRAAIQQARNNVQNPQQQGLPNGIPQQPSRNSATTAANPANGLPNSNGQNQLAVPAQNRPRATVPPNQMGGQAPMTNGLGVHQMPMNGVPQAQMQGMQGQHRLPVPNPALDINLVTQARRISEQQRQAVQMQQQSQHQGQNAQVHSSPPNMRNGVNGMSQQGFLPNMMPPFNPGNTNGVSTPPTSGMSVGTPGSGTASSPRMGQPSQPQPLSNNIVPPVSILDAQFRQKFPNCNQEQIHRKISDHLARPVHNHQRQQLSQAAMNAAAGGNSNGQPRVPSGVENSPQLYAQMLRAQQQRDSDAANQPQRSASANGGGQGK